MDIETAYKKLRTLENSQRLEAYKGKRGTIITATRTDKICTHDFKVGLLIPGRSEFYPTHVRLLFDLYIKRYSNIDDAKKLFCALEKMYDGADPEKLAGDVLSLKFLMQLDDPDVNLYYSQLLMVEQDFNYGEEGCKKSGVSPPREFLMRFIRWVASGDDEIDKIITNAVRNFPPKVQYKTKIKY